MVACQSNLGKMQCTHLCLHHLCRFADELFLGLQGHPDIQQLERRHSVGETVQIRTGQDRIGGVRAGYGRSEL
jgi:hypothetical protein